MSEGIELQLKDLPSEVARVLNDFLSAAKNSFREDLVSAVLFGSAAEGQLRPTSDVNLILVLKRFDGASAAQLRDITALSAAAIRLRVMFLLEDEIPSALEAFAQKFADILRRHQVLLGPDPFAGLSVPKPVLIFRLQQVLLNLTLRLRDAYIEHGARPRQLLGFIAEATGPIRTSAVSLRELEGHGSHLPKQAFAAFIESAGEPAWKDVPERLSAIREQRGEDPDPSALLVDLIAIISQMRIRASHLT
jgi:predicted nucleotidyltransferase